MGRMNRRRAYVLLLLGFGIAGVPSAEPEEAWTWEDCLSHAVEHNPRLRAAQARLRAAEEGVRLARSALRPQWSLGAGVDRSGVRDGAAPPGTDLRATLGVDQVLYAGGRLSARVAESEAGVTAAEAAAWENAAEVTFALRLAFTELLHAQEEQVLLERVETRRRDNLELVQLLYEGGKEHRGSVAISEAALFQAETDVRLARRRMEWARLALQRTAGLAEPAPVVRAAGALSVLPPPADVDWDDRWERTPEHARARAQLRAAASGVDRARGDFRPDITVSGSAGRYGDHREFDRDRWRAGVAVSYPLWPGGRNLHAWRQARDVLEETEWALEDLRNQVILNLADRLKDYRNAIDLVEVWHRFLAASELRADIARHEYTSGLVSFEDWARIENDLIDNRRRLLAAKQEAVRAEARWLRAAGFVAFDRPASREIP